MMDRPARGLHLTSVASVGLLVAGLVLGTPASAEPQLDPSTELRVDVPASREAATLEFKVVFTMPGEAQAYLKVSPKPGNPVFDNGSLQGKGWYTDVRLDGPDGQLAEGRTVGDPPMDFGLLAANVTYTLWLTAHAPAGTLAHATNYTLEYILAEHLVSESEGSGGTLDESVGLHAVARVQGEAEAAAAGIALWVWVAVGAAVAAIVVVLVVVARRRRRGPPATQR
jgi:hypothetical protein